MEDLGCLGKGLVRRVVRKWSSEVRAWDSGWEVVGFGAWGWGGVGEVVVFCCMCFFRKLAAVRWLGSKRRRMVVAFRRVAWLLASWWEWRWWLKNVRRARRESAARRGLERARDGWSERIWGGKVEGRMSISRIEGGEGWRMVMSWLYASSVEVLVVSSGGIDMESVCVRAEKCPELDRADQAPSFGSFGAKTDLFNVFASIVSIIMPSLLLIVFLLQLFIHLVNTVGAPVINELVCSSFLPTYSSIFYSY